MQWVIVTNDKAHGPFSTADEARNWAQDSDVPDWRVLQLESVSSPVIAALQRIEAQLRQINSRK